MTIPFTVEVDHLKQQFEALIAEFQNPRSFTSQGLNIAAIWCLQNNYGFEKSLEWAILAANPGLPGDPTFFSALITKAELLEGLSKADEAAAVIKTALSYVSMVQLQQFGRQLLTAKRAKAALKIFKAS